MFVPSSISEIRLISVKFNVPEAVFAFMTSVGLAEFAKSISILRFALFDVKLPKLSAPVLLLIKSRVVPSASFKSVPSR